MTDTVRDGIERGQFIDPGWMERYLVTFANYYRGAFLAFERGQLGAVPHPWRVAFGSALHGDSLIIQDSILGVNAHINYDLALTLNDVGIAPDRGQKYADHVAISDFLARLIDAQQEALAEVYAAGIVDIDAVFGRLDESFFLRSMTEGREQSWRVAVVLADGDVPPVASITRWLLRTTATGWAFFILGPRLDLGPGSPPDAARDRSRGPRARYGPKSCPRTDGRGHLAYTTSKSLINGEDPGHRLSVSMYVIDHGCHRYAPGSPR